MFRALHGHRLSPWVALVVLVAGLGGVRTWVDLSPEVESDFFFSEDDPQLAESLEIAERFPGDPQIIIRAEDLAGDEDAYEERIRGLTDDLVDVDGVVGVYSVTTENMASPLFRRLLLNPDSASTNLVLTIDDTPADVLLPRIQAELDARHGPELALVASGVPVIVELIRQSLFRDLVVFSSVALLLFGALATLVYRDAAIVTGTLVASLTSVSLTLLLTRVLGIGVGLLTANIVTIVFVLTLSHLVFLTANWKHAFAETDDRSAAADQAVRTTFEGSFWSMATTLLGFLSLLLATAKPLRELGIAGAIGTVTAIVVAYALYPGFLAQWARRPGVSTPARVDARAPSTSTPSRHTPAILGLIAAVVLVAGTGILRLDTDPGLLTYFAPGSQIREGLESVDRDGGSSTLSVVVRDADGGRIDDDVVNEKVWALQDSLEADPNVGVVLSSATLLGHARIQPLARFLSLSVLMDLAQSDALGGIGLGFATRERDQGMLMLRMRESVGGASRDQVMERIETYTRQVGLEPVLVGGLYDLQSQLGHLIASSLRIGLGGLLLLFVVIALVVSRAPATAGVMLLCLAGIPMIVLGAFGHAGVAIDIITSPAANVALAMGVDSMIHLVVRVRRLRESNEGWGASWSAARALVGPPVLSATLIICVGFGIFGLSDFPPTRRFGLAVILGTLTAATMTLVTLPGWARLRRTPSEETA